MGLVYENIKVRGGAYLTGKDRFRSIYREISMSAFKGKSAISKWKETEPLRREDIPPGRNFTYNWGGDATHKG
jgi:hypothetical protein